jgi:thiamine kinase-like enzyme
LLQGLGKEWIIEPAGGITGDAFYAEHNDKRLFLKRNSSPFLAVLSAEGIVPKLVWTKRLENGDVITAQHWLEGRELKASEMKLERVAKLLSKIHHSTELISLFMMMGKKPLKPETLIRKIQDSFKKNKELLKSIDYPFAMEYLQNHLNKVQNQPQVVCHCDVHHNNWLLSKNDQLYLIDWDNALIADPALDIGMVLQLYIPYSEWDSWLEKYGVQKDHHLMTRIHWYLFAQGLELIQWHSERKQFNQVTFWQNIIHQVKQHVLQDQIQ